MTWLCPRLFIIELLDLNKLNDKVELYPSKYS